jgi:hypothetical protein
MSQPAAQRHTPVVPAGAIAQSTLTPSELADVLALSGSAQVRAAFACGLSSALLPVLAIVLQDPELERMDGVMYLAALLLLAIALLCGLATFMERIALVALSVFRAIQAAAWTPLKNLLSTALFRALRSTGLQTGTRKRHRGSALGGVSLDNADPLDSLSPRAQRALASAVASHCAATLAVLGAFTASVAWVIR